MSNNPRTIFAKLSVLIMVCSVVFVLIVFKVTNTSLLILIISIALLYTFLLLLYFFKADIYENGDFRFEVYVTLMLIPIILQIMFGFLNFTFQETELRHTEYLQARKLYATLKETGDFAIKLPDEFSEAYLLDANKVLLRSSHITNLGKPVHYDVSNAYIYPHGENFIVLVQNQEHYTKLAWSIIVEILTTAVLSILFCIELVLFTLRIIRCSHAPEILSSQTHADMPHFIRQMAFLLLFANSMPSSFIPIIAKELAGVDEVGLIGLPQSATLLFTCFSIVIFPKLEALYGAKLPIMLGILLSVFGVLLCTVSQDLIFFIVARGIVGLGYGLSWMTLRNIAYMCKTQEARDKSFSALNSGLYAGIICGSVFGSVLVENFQNKTMVFGLSIVVFLIALLFIVRLPNAISTKIEKLHQAVKIKRSDVWQLLIFILLLLLPACLAESFVGLYFPLWIDANNYKYTDSGRAQLVYGICIVHLGPLLFRNFKLSAGIANVLYVVLLGGAFLLFFLKPSPIVGFAVCAMIAMADSFGFVAQNKFFLNSRLARKLSGPTAVSLLSFTKKIAATLGPIVFSLAILAPNGLFFMGSLFIVCAIIFLLIKRESEVTL